MLGREKKIASVKHNSNESTNTIIDNSRAGAHVTNLSLLLRPTMGDPRNRVIFMDCRTVTVTRDFDRILRVREGESLDKTQFRASILLPRPRSPTRKGPTRPNFRGTAIMTVIFLHLEERAHFLPAHPSSRPLAAVSLRLRRRRERSAPAILLKPTATIAPYPFFTFCLSAPRSYRGNALGTRNKLFGVH